MILYLSRKIAGAVGVLLVLSAFVFIAGRGLAPGNPASQIAGPKASPQTIANIEHSLGFDRPLWRQYLSWLGDVLHGRLGVSPISQTDNLRQIGHQLPVSLELGVLGLLIAILIGIPAGVYSATHAGRARDWVVRFPLVASFAFPAFVSGSVALYLGTHYLTNLYAPAYIPLSDGWTANLQMMLLPAAAVGIPTAPLIMQMTRSSMLSVLKQPYITTAHTSGISPWRITFVYGLRAAMPPVLTLIGFIFGTLIGGLFIVEEIFSLPGIGRGLLSSISSRDFSQATDQALVLAAMFILGNLIVDLLLPVVDRRIVRG